MGNIYSQYVLDPTTKEWMPLASSASYNDLADQPVVNAVGKTSETFVNLAGLDVGHYSLSGYYKMDSSYDIEQANYVMDILVMIDEVTGKKTLTYPTVENGEHVINIVTYVNGMVELFTKQRPGVANYWKPM